MFTWRSDSGHAQFNLHARVNDDDDINDDDQAYDSRLIPQSTHWIFRRFEVVHN